MLHFKRILVFFLIPFFSINAQVFNDYEVDAKVYKSIYFVGLQYPVFNVNSKFQAKFTFDVLTDNAKNLSYRIFHCNKNWEKSDLFYEDFATGFEDNYIDEYNYSFNTLQEYVNYNFLIPNNDLSFKITGNYILQVYDEMEPETILIQRRFMVVDTKVILNGKSVPLNDVSEMRYKQQLEFSIENKSYVINNPYQYLSASIIQNNNWHTLKSNILPTYIQNDNYIFNNLDDYIFDGINECRTFNISRLNGGGEFIRGTVIDSDLYHTYLVKEKKRSFNIYSSLNQDDNGNFRIYMFDNVRSLTEADYQIIHFELDMPVKFSDGEIYVLGDFNHWSPSEEFIMHFDQQSLSYKAEIKLKQGNYNYLYGFKKNDDTIVNLAALEGNHFETTNNYQVIIYYSDPIKRYDQIIGYQLIKAPL